MTRERTNWTHRETMSKYTCLEAEKVIVLVQDPTLNIPATKMARRGSAIVGALRAR